MRKCRYPDKPCRDRYYSSGVAHHKCRLDEWKHKKRICPYNPEIKSCSKRKKGQTELK